MAPHDDEPRDLRGGRGPLPPSSPAVDRTGTAPRPEVEAAPVRAHIDRVADKVKGLLRSDR